MRAEFQLQEFFQEMEITCNRQGSEDGKYSGYKSMRNWKANITGRGNRYGVCWDHLTSKSGTSVVSGV